MTAAASGHQPGPTTAAATAAAAGGMTGGGGGDASDALLRLHAQLAAFVPELRQVQQLLMASLALDDTSAVAPMLMQRLQQCEATILVLSAPLVVVRGREEHDMQVLNNLQAFITDSVTTLHEHKSLLEALAGPAGSQLHLDPTFSAMERQWLERGVALGPRRQPQDGAADGQQQAAQQQQQQQAPLPAAQPLVPQQHAPQAQHLPQGPAPLGLALLQQHQLLGQAGADTAGAAATRGGSGGSAGLGLEDFPFGRSIEMLPLLPSMGVGPSLSQLLGEPMTSLSMRLLSIREEGPDRAAAGGPPPPGFACGLYEEQHAPTPTVMAQQAGAAGPPGSAATPFAQLAGAALPPGAAAPAPKSAQVAPSPQGSGELQLPPNDSLAYRRVSFTPLHRGSNLAGSASSSLPLPAAAAAAPPPFPMRPSGLPPAAALPAAAALAFAGPAPTMARPPVTLLPGGAPVVLAGAAVLTAPAAAAPLLESAQDAEAAGAEAAAEPALVVAVKEGGHSHEFSEGETSLSKLFYEAKRTGVLPPPTPEEPEEGQPDGGGSGGAQACSGATRSGASGGSADDLRSADKQLGGTKRRKSID